LPLAENGFLSILKTLYSQQLSDCQRISYDMVIILTICPIAAFFIVKNLSQKSKEISFFITVFLTILISIILFIGPSFIADKFQEIVFSVIYQGWCVAFFTKNEQKSVAFFILPLVILFFLCCSFFALMGCV